MGDFGELLRNARAYRGVSLADAERATRINRRYLAALEQEAFDQLPPLTYARGIVRIYAQYLGLDPVTVLAKFEEAHGQRSMGFRVVPATRPPREPVMHWAPNFAVIAFMLAISAIVFALVYTTYLAPRQELAPTPSLSANAGRPTSGGEETVTNTPVPTLAARPTPPPTEPSPVATTAPTATLDSRTAESLSPTPPTAPTPEPVPTQATDGAHTFEIVTTGRVWVEVSVDGQRVLAEVLEPGARRTFRGQTMTVSSGNAPLVRVLVDGQDRGPLGQRWDDTNTYP